MDQTRKHLILYLISIRIPLFGIFFRNVFQSRDDIFSLRGFLF